MKYSFSEPVLSIIEKLQQRKNVLWINSGRCERLPPFLGLEDIQEAEKRLERFAPYLQSVFPALKDNNGIIESLTVPIPYMKEWLQKESVQKIEGQLWLKEDHKLPISGSIKARGGIYEVLTHAEQLALEKGLITEESDYRAFSGQAFKKLFSMHQIIVGSTGNLGLSIGIMRRSLDFV